MEKTLHHTGPASPNLAGVKAKRTSAEGDTILFPEFISWYFCCFRVVRLEDLDGMAQNSHRQYPKSASQSKLVGVSLQDGRISTEAGFSILEGVNSAFTARRDNSMPSAIVLRLTSHRKASILDLPLGRLHCKRWAPCSEGMHNNNTSCNCITYQLVHSTSLCHPNGAGANALECGLLAWTEPDQIFARACCPQTQSEDYVSVVFWRALASSCGG